MELIEYQVRLLIDEYEENKEEIEGLVNSEKKRLEGKTIRSLDGEIYNDQNHQRVEKLRIRNKAIINILSSSIVINKQLSSQIGVCSTFSVIFTDEEEEEVFTLIESKVSTEKSTDNFVTMNSDFGNAINRKGVNETFAYTTEDDNLISGVIKKLYNEQEQKEYLKTKKR